MNPPMFVIVTDGLGDVQRNLAFEAIKSASEAAGTAWWHHFSDVWIVQGKSAADWRDLVRSTGEASVLVLELTSGWAAYSPSKGHPWLHTQFG